jgi:predicted DNA-binding ribbon-helix-helix protein
MSPKEDMTMKTTVARQITLRLPEPLYQTVKRVAKRRRTSINQLAQEGLERLAQEELAAQMRAAYDEIGADAEGTDVEPFFPAQSEVVTHDPA